ncbi:MAG TPA: acyl carrier protein [Xanthobacteraceae bacterium]|nr:acyl carrier protein [Xanthobacteraceae bacterium]
MTQDDQPFSQAAQADASRPRIAVAAELKEHVCAVLTAKLADFLRAEDAAIDPARPLAEYGIDSTDFLTLVFEIEEQFSCRFQPETFFDIETLDDLAERIGAALLAQDKAPPERPQGAP